jgi:hypothetical protein
MLSTFIPTKRATRNRIPIFCYVNECFDFWRECQEPQDRTSCEMARFLRDLRVGIRGSSARRSNVEYSPFFSSGAVPSAFLLADRPLGFFAAEDIAVAVHRIQPSALSKLVAILFLL